MLKSSTFDKWIGTSLGNYRLEQFIEQSNWGPVFLARSNANSTGYLLRFLIGSVNQSSKSHELYLERFQYQASQIAALQHPNILPLIDFGVYRGLPYLVSPQMSMRSLLSRLDRNVPLDVFTIGRYLDQIATALEYGHEHAVLHESLSVDCIFIRLDGQLVVADFGVRKLLESGMQDTEQNLIKGLSDVTAPEQLLGKPGSPATDVYALGAVLYHMLAGTPVFVGSTYEELAQQHLYASVPPLSRWRSDLPSGLYSIIARALAKDPAQRFSQPGMLANAYHRIVTPNNKIRTPFIVSTTPATDLTLTERAWSPNGSVPIDQLNGQLHSTSQASMPHSLYGFVDDDSSGLSPRPELLRRFQRRKLLNATLIMGLILLLVIASGLIGGLLLSQRSSAVYSVSGQATFFTNQDGQGGLTDALNIVVHDLDMPPTGSEYAVWLINQDTEAVVALGTLKVQNQTGSLTYSTNSNLLSPGDKFEITQEQGTAVAPAGKVILTGTFPIKSFPHVGHLLINYPETPGKIGLLVGVLEQTRLLNIQATVLQNIAASQNTVAIGCEAQSILDIIEGKHGSHYRQLDKVCAFQNVTTTGDGFGLQGKKGYLTGSTNHAGYAISQPDATSSMHVHTALMDASLSNINRWLTTIDQDALFLQTHPTDVSKVEEIVRLADYAYYGVDVNGDGQIDPVPGEAGAKTAFQQGQLIATLSLYSSQ
ncbi:MAG TPA: serine/threonine-protein kinase [Ktedonobacteraceae bacterium]|nr:serine/threonine-protein kinase [Ktedonobacteraceae bacterium]